MQTKEIVTRLDVYNDSGELAADEQELLSLARQATRNAYAPYSGFQVGAAIRLADGTLLSGTNQENASYPAGLCAERVALSAASALYPGVPVTALAVAYFNLHGNNDRPISPCGICRQTLAEYQQRSAKPIRIILAGGSGEVFVLAEATGLLPLAFTSEELK